MSVLSQVHTVKLFRLCTSFRHTDLYLCLSLHFFGWLRAVQRTKARKVLSVFTSSWTVWGPLFAPVNSSSSDLKCKDRNVNINLAWYTSWNVSLPSFYSPRVLNNHDSDASDEMFCIFLDELEVRCVQRFTGSPVLTGPEGKSSGAEKSLHFWREELKNIHLTVFEPSLCSLTLSLLCQGASLVAEGAAAVVVSKMFSCEVILAKIWVTWAILYCPHGDICLGPKH